MLARAIGDALDRLSNADADTARDIDEPFAEPVAPGDTAAVVAGWPTMTGEQITRQIAAMTPEQRAQLVNEAPSIVGDTDGPAVGHAGRRQPRQHRTGDRNETGTDPNAKRRIAFYQELLGDVDAPAGTRPSTVGSWHSTRPGPLLMSSTAP